MNAKILYMLLLVIFASSFVGCFEKEVNYLQERDGLMYEVNQEEGFTGKYVHYWDEKETQLKEVRNLKLGLRHGTQTEWYEDGQKKAEENWKNGKPRPISRA